MTGEQLAISCREDAETPTNFSDCYVGMFLFSRSWNHRPGWARRNACRALFPELWNRTPFTHDLLRCHFMRLMVLFRFGCRRIDHLRYKMFECGGGISTSAGVNR